MRWSAEQRVETLIRHRKAGAIVEVVEVEAKRSVRLAIDQIVVDEPGVFRGSRREQGPSPCTHSELTLKPV
jgi:hypothetical protein